MKRLIVALALAVMLTVPALAQSPTPPPPVPEVTPLPTPPPPIPGLSPTPPPMPSPSVSPSTSARIIHNLPGAGRAVIVYDTSRVSNDTQGLAAAAIADSAGDFAKKFAQTFGVQTTTVDAHWNNMADLASIALQNNAIVAVPLSMQFQGKTTTTGTSSWSAVFGIGTSSAYTTLQEGLTLSSGIVDLYGEQWFYAAPRSKNITTGRDFVTAVSGAFGDLNDQVIVEFKTTFGQSDASMVTNLFRYGLPIATGQKKSGFGIKPASNGAQVSTVWSFGAAAKAGLQLGDTILAVNGTTTIHKTQDELTRLLVAVGQSDSVDLTILDIDGKPQHVIFSPQPLSWYIEHRIEGATK